ncbi:hypothetical protein KRMM14A1004_59860 [Krasilnikovia sp. MM14-A1004]
MTAQIKAQGRYPYTGETSCHAIKEPCLMPRHPTAMYLNHAELRAAVRRGKIAHEAHAVQGAKPNHRFGQHENVLRRLAAV